MILEGLEKHASGSAIPPEMIATMVGWAIHGAAKEWVRTPNRSPSEEIVEMVMSLISPILGTTHA